MNIDDTFYLGYIAGTKGFNGELQVKLDTDAPENYKELESVFLNINESLVPFFIKKIKINNKSQANIIFEDYESLDKSKELVGVQLHLPLSFLPKLTGNKFYYHEVIDFTVVDHLKGEIGKVSEVLEYPKQAVLSVMSPNDKEILIPIIDEVVKTIDRENSKIQITAPEGLIDLYLEEI